MTALPKGKPARSGLKVYIAEFKGVYLQGSIVVVAIDRGHAARLANQKLETCIDTFYHSKNANPLPTLTSKDFHQINNGVAGVVFFNDGDY